MDQCIRVVKSEKAMVEQPVIGVHRRAYKKRYGWFLKSQITRTEFDALRDKAKINAGACQSRQAP